MAHSFIRVPLFLGLAVLLAVCSGCSGSDSNDGSRAPTCSLASDPNILASPHTLYASPNDRYGIQAVESASSIQVAGSLDPSSYGVVDLNFTTCVDTAEYSGVSFRVSRFDSSTLGKMTLFADDLDDVAEARGGSCRPSSSATTYTDCSSTSAMLDIVGSSASLHKRWSDFTGGAPHFALFEPKLLRLVWVFGGESEPASVNFTIDQLEFF